MDKKTIFKTLLFLGGAGLVVGIGRYIVRQGRLLKEWDFKVDKFRLKTIMPLSVAFDFIFINKSAVQAEIKNIKINVFTDSNAKIGTITKAGPLIINADAESPLSVDITVDGKDIKKETVVAVTRAVLDKKDLPLYFIGTAQLRAGFGWVTLPIKSNSSGKELLTYAKKATDPTTP
jgi:hypothetical protein